MQVEESERESFKIFIELQQKLKKENEILEQTRKKLREKSAEVQKGESMGRWGGEALSACFTHRCIGTVFFGIFSPSFYGPVSVGFLRMINFIQTLNHQNSISIHN